MKEEQLPERIEATNTWRQIAVTNPRFLVGANSNGTAFTILGSKQQQYLVINFFFFWNRTQIKRQYCYSNFFFQHSYTDKLTHRRKKKVRKRNPKLLDIKLIYIGFHFTQSQQRHKVRALLCREWGSGAGSDPAPCTLADLSAWSESLAEHLVWAAESPGRRYQPSMTCARACTHTHTT